MRVRVRGYKKNCKGRGESCLNTRVKDGQGEDAIIWAWCMGNVICAVETTVNPEIVEKRKRKPFEKMISLLISVVYARARVHACVG